MEPLCSVPLKRILILGHTGLLGKSLLGHLKARIGDVEILGLSSSEINLLDYQDVKKLTPLFSLETGVVMCSMIKKESGDNLENFSKNLQMVQNLCRLLQISPVGKFIYLSSAAVYGENNHNLEISEQTPINPTSYYGLAKYASEGLLSRCLTDNGQTSLSILRPPVFYGPGDKYLSYGPANFIKNAIHNKDIVLWGDGEEKREFIFLEDILEIITLILQKKQDGAVNLVSGRSYTFKDILNCLAKINPTPLKIINRPRTKMKVDHQFNNGLIKILFPHFRFTNLEEGIVKTYHYELEMKSYE